MLHRLPGHQTRQDIIASAWPTGQSLVHGGIFLSGSSGLYILGYTHVAQTVAVLAAATVINGSVARVAGAIAEGIRRLWTYYMSASRSSTGSVS